MLGSRKRREIGVLGFQRLMALAEAQIIARRMIDIVVSNGHYGNRDTAPESARELGEGRGLGVCGHAEMGLQCNYAVNGGPALPGHWGKNIVTTSLGVPSPVLIRNPRTVTLTKLDSCLMAPRQSLQQWIPGY